MRKERRSSLAIALILLLGFASALGFVMCDVAHADNNCWNGADYSTSAAGGHEDSAVPTTGTSHYCQATVTNNSASTVWAMVFDAAALPANGTKPKLEWNVPAGIAQGEFGYGMFMASGVVVACSSTEGTLTVTVASACNFHVTVSR